MSGNGSYQNNGPDGKGHYQSIDGNKSHDSGSKKWITGAVVLAVLVGAGYFLTHKPAGAATEAAVKKAALPTSGKTGKLKLFDDDRKYCRGGIPSPLFGGLGIMCFCLGRKMSLMDNLTFSS